ncbi:hypothetical protein GKQ23_12205 [Erwinia sp. E602]|uniref:hypothetical protein n=1 Tax=unclassified Erwinia TaxID=2622719 RepID=UPI0012E182E3|nr:MULTISPECIES: hypothetical protein [unclassified Erwinia]QUG75705.1 hypothetical protein GKQ23_12205 [Erwinia sp. E602]
MDTGFYWIGTGLSKPQVWFYRHQSGFFKPANAVPMTLTRFEAEGFKFLSEKLTFPHF